MKKFLIAAMLMTFMFAGSAFAADVDIGEGYHFPDGFAMILITSSDGSSIQNAVDQIQDGGTIYLSGNFKLKKNITINKNLTISGMNNTVLDGNINLDGIIICEKSNDITLENLAITNGGGGVIIRKGSNVKIISCDIYENYCFLGGGILSHADTLTLMSCDIHNNAAMLGKGGGIYLEGGTVTITDCNITDNTAAVCGGGLDASKATITMQNCTITGNKSVWGGGINLINLGTKLTAISCDISGNTATISSPDISLQSGATYEEVNEEEESSNE